MNNPTSPFEKWRLETIPQVGFTPEIRELLAMAFEGGRQSVKQEWQSLSDDEIVNLIPHHPRWWDMGDEEAIKFTRAIEQASKEKNHESIYK